MDIFFLSGMLITWWARYKEQCSIYIHNKMRKRSEGLYWWGICHFWTLVSSQTHRLYIFFLSSNLVSKVIHDVCILLATISWIYSPEILNSSFQCLLNYHIFKWAMMHFWACPHFENVWLRHITSLAFWGS